MRFCGLHERHDALNLRLDLALDRRCEALRQIGRLIARPTDDGDLIMIKVCEIDGHVRPAMGAGGHQASAEAERHEGLGQHFRVGDVVVEHVGALAVGEPHHLGANILRVVVDAVVGAERQALLDALVAAGCRDHLGTNHVPGDLDAGHAEIAAGAHDEHSLTALKLGGVDEKIPGGGAVAHHHGGVMEVDAVGQRNDHASWHADQLSETTWPFDAHHALRPVIIGAVLRHGLQRHAAGRGHVLSDCPARDAGPERVDRAGAVDARNERQHRSAAGFLAGAQVHVEDPVNGRRVDPDPDLASPRLRVRHVLVFQDIRRTKLVDHDRLHAAPCSCLGCGGCRRCAISTLVSRHAKGRDAAQFAWLCCSPPCSLPKVRPENAERQARGKGPMTISMYKVSVPIFIQFLSAQSAIIDKLAAHIDAKKYDANYYFNLRFFADMYPYARQVQQASTHAARCCSALAGVPMPDLPNTEKTFAELKARLAKTIDFCKSIKPEQIDGTEDKQIVLKLGDNERKFTGQILLLISSCRTSISTAPP